MSSFYGNHGSIGSGDSLPSVQPTDEGKALIVQNGAWVPGIIDTNELPTVTENDNNKVLTVVNGEWTAAESVQFSGLQNFIDGTADGSIRSVLAVDEDENYTLGRGSVAEGERTTASGVASHAEGFGGKFTIDNVEYTSGAVGTADHTEGYQTLTANGQPGNHAEGYWTRATGGAAHAEGYVTIASGAQSHAEGYNTTASGYYSHAEGGNTKASGNDSHAEGGDTKASGDWSHAEGAYTTASGSYAHAEGNTTIANHRAQHVFGEFNVEDPSTARASARGTYVEIVGNGTKSGATESRSNARTLDWSGNEALAGGLTVGAAGITIGSTTITEAQLTALLGLLNS